MSSYFPYSQIIAGYGVATVTKHSYFSAWSVSDEERECTAPSTSDDISEIYY